MLLYHVLHHEMYRVLLPSLVTYCILLHTVSNAVTRCLDHQCRLPPLITACTGQHDSWPAGVLDDHHEWCEGLGVWVEGFTREVPGLLFRSTAVQVGALPSQQPQQQPGL